ncbi:glycosyltransferase family 2 protein [Polynucleobacter paneuropaeus]|uniref:glycosyltransferase family 2 protein n=1 Tax=Polynucleobacter paneuropaeus TaxID=2527775 RepID=UPI000DBF2DC2|nr:glycosyltransferase family 2 protein [Polynucleobacter paneuropaeus]AWW47463.1 glycosyltransferase family 2 protein [Polynucleobacter paneuropaeus]
MAEFQLTTPVAFFIFNRPRETRRVFEEIAKAKPKTLFVIADGPRPNVMGEDIKVFETREIIKKINWDCELLTNFSNINLGCKVRVSSGIDWLFEKVEEAIILEDDCLPEPSFFQFCQELLERYRYDSRIGMISGDNFQFGFRLNDDSYYFSNMSHIWGWATWRSRWQSDYDVSMQHWPKVRNEQRVSDWTAIKSEQKSLIRNFEKTYQGKIDTWDHQWNFCSRNNGRISVMPNVNLISNIGFGIGATHTIRGSELANMTLEKMQFPLKHPVGIHASTIMDTRFHKQFGHRRVGPYVKNKLKNILASLNI